MFFPERSGPLLLLGDGMPSHIPVCTIHNRPVKSLIQVKFSVNRIQSDSSYSDNFVS